MIKVKTWWYYNLARGLSVDSNSNAEKYLWKTILENKYDDVCIFIFIFYFIVFILLFFIFYFIEKFMLKLF